MMDFSIFVGVDVCKDWLDIHVLPSGDAFRLANDSSGLAQLVKRLRRLKEGKVALGAEASGGYEKRLLDRLAEAGFTVFCLDPAAVRAYARAMGRRAKTDPIDAAMIAGLLAARADGLHPYQPRPDLDRLAQLVAYRDRLIAERTRLAADQARLDDPLLRRLTKRRLASLALAIRQLDDAIADRIRQSPDHKDLATRLGQIPGVGKTLLATLITHLPELGQITPKAIAALVGLAPFDRSSGNTVRKAHCSGGRPYVRRVLYMATLAAIRCKNPPLAGFYLRLVKAGKPPKLAIIATMRKFITILNAIARDGSTWSVP